MPSHFDRVDFAPPAQPGLARGMGMAVFAHVLLLAALTWGVNWKRQTSTVTAEVELWSSIPQQAAPRAVTPPPPPPPPKPEPKPEPAPAPPPVDKAPDIVDKQDKPPKKPVEKPAEKPPEPKAKPEAKPDPAALKKEAQKKAAEEAKQLDAQREENLQRMAGIAGSSGGPTATGNAVQSSGPSSGYGGRIKAKVKPNLVFSATVSGNPLVSIEVRMAPDGTILGQPRIVKSSGNREWDEAVVRAFEKTEVLPRDTDGRVHSPLIVDWRVND
jgi:colicin import membrane protein